ncbi:unnamed protein product [Peronospora effusa]|nr:unnamed protein product [Peronospora effusa]
MMTLDVLPGESRGYWKHHAPGKWFKQAKASGKVNNIRANLLFDSGAEISILNIAIARKVGCQINTSEKQECVGIGEAVYTTEGRTKIKITLNGVLVYFFNVWVGSMAGQDVLLGMDFMVPAGIRLDMADGTICLPDEVRIHLTGRKTLYSGHVSEVKLGQYVNLPATKYVEVPLKKVTSDQWKLWMTRGDRWVTTMIQGHGHRQFLRVTNVSDKDLILHEDTKLGIWLSKDRVPRAQGFVSVGSRRYAEWKNLAYQATTDEEDPETTQEEVYQGPMVEKPQYATPHKMLLRTGTQVPVINAVHESVMRDPESLPSDQESGGEALDRGQPSRASMGNEVSSKDRTDMERVHPEEGPQVHPEEGPPVHPEEGPPVHPEEGPPATQRRVHRSSRLK